MNKETSKLQLESLILLVRNGLGRILTEKQIGKGYTGFLALAGVLAALLCTFAALDRQEAVPLARSKTVIVPEASISQAEPGAADVVQSAEPEVPPYHQTLTFTLDKGDSLFDVLKRQDIPASQIYELVNASRPVHDLGRMREGQTCALDYDNRDGSVLRFETDLDYENRLVVKREETGLLADKEIVDYDIRQNGVFGTIDDSLFLAAERSGLPTATTLRFSEIFGWDIDFHVDIREGDTFQVLYENKYLNGDFVRTGNILAAEILNRGRPFWAFYFEGKDGRKDYYDQEGRSLRKAFLKSPLTYTRISSGFSRRRFHPILKIYRPHLGVDYAAPTGTPVRSIGDGRLIFVGRKNGFGRYMEVKHNDTYTTTYGHLSRFAKGMKTGKYVSQGEVIGYVGQSGLATGPHLDFRLLKNGTFVNPLTVNFPDADPVNEEDMPAFKKCVEQYMADLKNVAAEKEISGPILSKASQAN